MRITSCFLLLPLSGAVAACGVEPIPPTSEPPGTPETFSGSGADASGTDANDPTATKVVFKSGIPLQFAAFRDDSDPTWHAANQKSPTRFVVQVHGPYRVTAVCDSVIDEGDGTTLTQHVVWQAAFTLDDPLTQSIDVCGTGTIATEHAVSGAMVQPGTVIIGDNFIKSPTPNWSFGMAEPNGKYTMYADTADRIAIRRNIKVKDDDITLSPTIDVNQQGSLLGNVAFSIPNLVPGAATQVSVRIEQATATFPGPLYLGPIATAKAIPNIVLDTDDNQTASVREIIDTTGDGFTREAERALRKPFRIGDPTAFTMPDAIVNPAWAFDASGQLVASWTSLPTSVLNDVEVFGNNTGTEPVDYEGELSLSFLSQTGTTSVTLDNNIPGFLDAWKIDYASFYFRELVAQSALDGELGVIRTVSVTDSVFDNFSLRAAARRARPLDLATRLHGLGKAKAF